MAQSQGNLPKDAVAGIEDPARFKFLGGIQLSGVQQEERENQVVFRIPAFSETG